MITEQQINEACNKAYKEAGQNAYFENGFKKGVNFGKEATTETIISYIENDSEILIPIDEMINKEGKAITKKEYGIVLLKYLLLELREKFNTTEL